MINKDVTLIAVRKSSKRGFLRATITVLLLTLSASSFSQHVYYRYVNKDGVKVLDQKIPPEYAQLGYEVINASGQVMKVVPPAPSAEDMERNAAERETRERYARLKRRYSSTTDIESAKQRRLRNIDTNISILKGNISTLESQIEQVVSQAAGFERRGQSVPKSTLEKLANLRAERAVATELLGNRNAEYLEVIKKFDDDIKSFTEGEAFEQASNAKL